MAEDDNSRQRRLRDADGRQERENSEHEEVISNTSYAFVENDFQNEEQKNNDIYIHDIALSQMSGAQLYMEIYMRMGRRRLFERSIAPDRQRMLGSDAGEGDNSANVEGVSVRVPEENPNDVEETVLALQNFVQSIYRSSVRQCGNIESFTDTMRECSPILTNNAVISGIKCVIDDDLLTCVYKVSNPAQGLSGYLIILDENAKQNERDQFLADVAFEWLRSRSCTCQNNEEDVARLVVVCKHILCGMGVVTDEEDQPSLHLDCRTFTLVLEMTYLLPDPPQSTLRSPVYPLPTHSQYVAYLTRTLSIEQNIEEFTVGDRIPTPAPGLQRMLKEYVFTVVEKSMSSSESEGVSYKYCNIENRTVSFDGEESCCLCLNDICEGQQVVILPQCKHAYHADKHNCLGTDDDDDDNNDQGPFKEDDGDTENKMIRSTDNETFEPPPIFTYFLERNTCPQCRAFISFEQTNIHSL